MLPFQIAVGDHIVAVDGEQVSGRSLAELAEKLLGPTASVVECSFVRKSDGQRYAVSLARGVNADKWASVTK